MEPTKTTGKMETIETTSLSTKYVESLSEKEYKAYVIAKSHLGTSFHLEKSLGFIKWNTKYMETSI